MKNNQTVHALCTTEDQRIGFLNMMNEYLYLCLLDKYDLGEDKPKFIQLINAHQFELVKQLLNLKNELKGCEINIQK